MINDFAMALSPSLVSEDAARLSQQRTKNLPGNWRTKPRSSSVSNILATACAGNWLA